MIQFKTKDIEPTEVHRAIIFRMARAAPEKDMVKIKVLKKDDTNVLSFNPFDDLSR